MYQVIVQANGVDMTDAIHTYAEEKMSSLDKFFDGITKVDLICGMHSQHHNKGKIYFCEVNVSLPQKTVHIEKEAEDLYKAIDKVKDHLKIELEKIKGKLHAKDHELIREQKAYHMDEE